MVCYEEEEILKARRDRYTKKESETQPRQSALNGGNTKWEDVLTASRSDTGTVAQ